MVTSAGASEGPRPVELSAVGDVVAYHDEPERAFQRVAAVLAEADLVFAQNERHISDRVPPVTGDMVELAPVAHAKGLATSGIDVVSWASNHSMDFGPDFMLETAGHLQDLGFEVIGVGHNEDEARRPLVVERHGLRIGFLAYCSVLRPGEEASPKKPGVAPLRAYTHYHQVDYQPGNPPDILTFAHPGDLAAAERDVGALRDQVDVVLVSVHWGLHFSGSALAMYQREIAHRLVEAGADAILGHHPHELKAVEVHRGRPIFYSLGNFAFDQPQRVIRAAMEKSAFVDRKTVEWGFEMDDPEWVDYSFPPNSRYSMIARLRLGPDGVERTAFLPVLINGRAQPEVVGPDDERFGSFVAYMHEISAREGVASTYAADGPEIVVG